MPPVQARLSMDERIEAEAARLAEDLLVEAVAGTILASTPGRVEATVHTALESSDAPWAPVPVRTARKFLKDVPEAALDLMFPTVYEEDRSAKLRDLVTTHDVGAITHQRMAAQMVKELGIDEDYDYTEEQAKIVEEQRTMAPPVPLGSGDALARGVVGQGGGAGAPAGGAPAGGTSPGLAGGKPVQASFADGPTLPGSMPRRDQLSGDATREFRQQQRQAESQIRQLTNIVEALRDDLHALREAFDPAQHPREPAGSEQGGEFTAAGGGAGGGDAGAGGGAAASGDGSGTDSKAAAQQEFKRLKGEWARVNNSLLEFVDSPNSPQAQEKMNQLQTIVKQMYRLDADPGGLEGIGLPGGPRDILIVGAGPGGLAAAVMGGADGLDTMFIDANPAVGGQAKFSSRIENYPGFPVGTTGQNLAKSMHDQATRVGAEGELGVRATGLSYDEATGLKTVTLSDGRTITSRAVVLAGGVEFRKMDFPGADSSSVIYGDGEMVRKASAGKVAVILGGSNGAAQAALGAARSAKQVYVVSRSPISKGMSDYQVSAVRAHPKIQVIENDEISRLWIDEHGQASSAELKSGKRVDANVLGVFIGGGPNLSWLPTHIERQEGKLKVNADLETNIPGVFAVGDTRHGSIGRIGAAVGDGQMAERNVWQYFERAQAKLRKK